MLAAWTLFIVGLSIHEIRGIKRITREMAVSEVRAYFNKDRALRIWGASHGGIYVPVSERTPASPYLANIPERDIQTPSGKPLTLMNPAYMMRQVSEDFSSLYGIVARTTSLNPLRPGNSPDKWESRALKEFEDKGLAEKLEFTSIGNTPYLRLIQPVIVKKECLHCHGHQGYDIGDIRGGISIGLPMTEPLALQEKQIAMHIMRAGAIWLAGLLGLFWGGSVLRNRIEERDLAQAALERSRDRLARKKDELAAANDALTGEIEVRKQAEAEILRREEQFRTVADFTYDWEYWMDPAGNYLYVSPSSERITGYAPEEFKANPSLIMEITHPDHKPQLKNHFLHTLEERNVCMMEFRIISREGKERWIAHTCQPVYNQAGEFLGRRASNRDITGQKWTEKALNKFAVDLAYSNKDLQDFAYMASHDLREPLVLIQAFSERLRKRCADDFSERGIEYLNRIESSTARMQELINGILTYSRVATKGHPFMDVDIRHILLELISDLELRLKQAGGRVDIGSFPPIKADPLQVRQLFQNLITNAIKYRRTEAPPVVRIYSETFIACHDENRTEYCRITVEDNGIGFEQNSVEQIFGLFQRLHGRSEYEGTGIGLAVCKRIVDRHDGDIAAESIPGKGSKFIVTLPVDGPAMDEQQQNMAVGEQQSLPYEKPAFLGNRSVH